LPAPSSVEASNASRILGEPPDLVGQLVDQVPLPVVARRVAHAFEALDFFWQRCGSAGLRGIEVL
jgi:hypothetical protein